MKSKRDKICFFFGLCRDINRKNFFLEGMDDFFLLLFVATFLIGFGIALDNEVKAKDANKISISFFMKKGCFESY